VGDFFVRLGTLARHWRTGTKHETLARIAFIHAQAGRKQMWRKTGRTTPNATRAPDLTINLGWPDSAGFTQCSNDYYSVCMSLETFNPASFASPTPEDYERYAELLRERNRLIAEGHTGKSFRLVKTASESETTNKKIRITQGYFLTERQYDALIELTAENPIGSSEIS
jgi:hypothetical protein